MESLIKYPSPPPSNDTLYTSNNLSPVSFLVLHMNNQVVLPELISYIKYELLELYFDLSISVTKSNYISSAVPNITFRDKVWNKFLA